VTLRKSAPDARSIICERHAQEAPLTQPPNFQTFTLKKIKTPNAHSRVIFLMLATSINYSPLAVSKTIILNIASYISA
jgi:hypothetical protein